MPLFTTIMQFNIPFRKGLQLFQSYIDPILLYNAENQTAMTDRQIERCKQDQTYIYTLCNESPLTTTQLKFTKFLLGVGKHCPNMSIFGESAALPLHTRAHIHMLKFWDRIKNMAEHTLVNMAYRENVMMNTNWCKTIQILNAKYNFHFRQYEPKDFPSLVKKIVKLDFTSHWKSRITSPEIEKRLNLYSKIKNDFKIDPYTDLPFRDRQIISKMLCVSHKLEVETGRYQPDMPREKRICQVCTLNKVEDEEHFISECPAYGKIRNQYLGSTNYPDIKNLLSDREPLTVATFLRKAYTLREQILEGEPDERYHVAQKKGLKMVIRKGHKTKLVSNVVKDGLKIKLKLVP